MAKVLVEESSLQSIADAIRGKNGESSLYTPAQMATAIAGMQVGTGGGESILDYCSSVPILQNGIFEDGQELIVRYGAKTTTVSLGNASLAYVEGLQTARIIYEGTAIGSCSMDSWARACSLVTLDLTGVVQFIQITNLNRAFRDSKALKEILGELDLTHCTSATLTFANCYALETIRIKPGTLSVSFDFSYSGLLTEESVQSIIDGLADLTGGTAQTLTLRSTVGAKLTDEQKAAASAKNWTISY